MSLWAGTGGVLHLGIRGEAFKAAVGGGGTSQLGDQRLPGLDDLIGVFARGRVIGLSILGRVGGAVRGKLGNLNLGATELISTISISSTAGVTFDF